MKIKLDPGAYMPARAHEDDAGMDLFSMEDKVVWPVYKVGDGVVFDTGVHLQIPKGCYGEVASRSGLDFNNGIVVAGCGRIDSGYTGSIKVKLYNLGPRGHAIRKGDKIAQIIIQEFVKEPLELVSHLDETERGDNGFGSSGR